jgi:hypothetical protein
VRNVRAAPIFKGLSTVLTTSTNDSKATRSTAKYCYTQPSGEKTPKNLSINKTIVVSSN